MDPPIEDLLDKVDSKFTLVALSAKRARQINSYYNQLGEGLGMVVPPQVTSVSGKPLTIAFEEISAGKATYHRLEPGEEDETDWPWPRRRTDRRLAAEGDPRRDRRRRRRRGVRRHPRRRDSAVELTIAVSDTRRRGGRPRRRDVDAGARAVRRAIRTPTSAEPDGRREDR